MIDESNTISPFTFLPTQLHSKFRSILFPNETWEEIEHDRISKFSKYDQDEKSKRFDKRDSNGKLVVGQNLKNLLRYGIPCNLRAKYWLLVSGGQFIIDNGFCYYEDMKEKVISENFLQQSKKPFGVPIEYLENFCGFNEDVISFIQVIYYHNQKTIKYAPFIPRVCFILLTFLKDQNSAYAAIQSLINNNHDGWYFETSIDEFMISAIAIQNLCHSKAPKVFQHCQSLNIDITELFLMFVFGKGYLSTPVTLTFFDSYINEGKKVFYRFFLSFLIQETKSILQSNSAEEIKQCFEKFNQAIDDDAHLLIEFIKKSFSLPLSRSRIIKPDHNKKSHQKGLATESSLPEYPNRSHATNDEFSINLAPLFDAEMNDEYSYENDSTNESYSQNNKNNDSPEHSNKSLSATKSELNRVDRFKVAELRRHSFVHAYSSLISQIDDNSVEATQSTEQLTSTSNENKENSNGNESNENNNNHHHHHHHHQKKRKINHQIIIIQNELPKIEPEIALNKVLPVDSILSDNEFSIIRSFMPLFSRISNPIRTYKLSNDGASFFSFQCGVTENCPYLLVIRTQKRTVGAFLSDPPTNKSTANSSASLGSSNDTKANHSACTTFSLPDYHSVGTYSSKIVNNIRRPGQHFGKITTFVFSIKHKKKKDAENEIDDSNAIDIDGNPSKVSVFPSVANCAYSRNNSNTSNSSDLEDKSENHHKKASLRSLFKKKSHKNHHHHNHNYFDNSNSSNYNDSNHSSHTSNTVNSNSSNSTSTNNNNLRNGIVSNCDIDLNDNNNNSNAYDNAIKTSTIDDNNSQNSINNIPIVNISHSDGNIDKYIPTLFSDSNILNEESTSGPHFTVYRDKNDNSTSSNISETNEDSLKDSEEYYYKRSFISVFQDSLSIGGPGPAIFIQDYLTKLYSYESKTFNSPSFTDHKNGDDINDVELYTLKKM